MRDVRVDHYKGILILLVVTGHCINAFSLKEPWIQCLNHFIYFFHMPAFFFLSGMYHKISEKFPWRKTCFYLLIGLSLRIIVLSIQCLFGKYPEWNLFDGTGVYWFAFVMGYYQGITWLLRKLPAKIVVTGSVFLSVVCGYFPVIGTSFHLSRTIVFYPFFYIGMRYGKDMFRWIASKKEIAFLGLEIGILSIPLQSVKMFTGRNSYEAIGLEMTGGFFRLFWIITVLIFLVSLFAFLPKKEIGSLAYLGKHTLSIYYWHRIFLYILSYAGFPMTSIGFLGFSVGLACLTARLPVPFSGIIRKR